MVPDEHIAMQEETAKDAEVSIQTDHGTDAEESLDAALERRRMLPLEERGAIRPPQSIRNSHKSMAKWTLISLYQDRPILVIVASAIIVFEIIKTLADLVAGLF